MARHGPSGRPGLFHLLKFALVVVVAALLDPSLGAPKGRDPQEDRWWFNPCEARLRHTRSPFNAEVALRNQMKIFVTRLRSEMHNIEQLYKLGAAKAKASNSKSSWLKVNKMVRTIANAKKRSKDQAFRYFHKYLQYFAETLEVLLDVKIEQNINGNFNEKKRQKILKNVSQQLRGLLCEVQFAVGSDTDVKDIPISNKGIPVQSLKQLDLTSAQMTDVTFFKRTLAFFKKTQKLLFSRKDSKKSKKKTSVAKKNTKT